MAISGDRRIQRERVTIRDIARVAGVSVATVSRVMNDRPDVSPETRESVLRVARAHNFTTNRSARGLSVGRTGLIGFTLPWVDEHYFTGILAGATEALHEQEQRVVLCPTHHEHDREVSLLERLMNGTTDGAIVLLPEESPAELRALNEHGFPFVVADPRQPLDEGVPVVSAAHGSGARSATEHLIRLGHRRIGLITGFPGWTATEERIAGYKTALASAGLPLVSELVVEGEFNAEAGYVAAARLLDRVDRPTAIFASNDNTAVGTMRAALERGMRIPEDLSIVGFDDTEVARNVWPRLTTVRQPLAELGRTAVSLLNRLIEGQRTEALRIELATRLIVRESTGPPPA